MTRPASNSDRIARAAAEVAASDREKAEMKKKRAAAATTPAKKRPSAAKAGARMKIVWAVGRPGLVPVKTYPYPDRAAADTDAAGRGGDFRVVGLKVPME